VGILLIEKGRRRFSGFKVKEGKIFLENSALKIFNEFFQFSRDTQKSPK
jgi:hypothetical protein